MNDYNKTTLLKRARRRTVGFDSYRGVWDKPIWLVVRVKEKFGSALGPVFEAGDIALARYGRDIPGTPPGIADTLFAYSFRSGGESAIHDYDILEGTS